MNMNIDRKRKSTDAHEGNERKKKRIIENKTSLYDGSDERSSHGNEVIDEGKIVTTVVNRWPQDDVKKLLTKIESVLPKIDNTTFKSRFTKLDWGQVQFDNYSKDECQATWLAIQDQLRTYKTLGELVQDAKNLLDTKGIDTHKSKQNRVQKPKSAYMLFFTEMLQEYKKIYPDSKLPQLTQMIAKKYKNLLPEQKQPYVDKAHKLKSEYNELVCKTNLDLKPKINTTMPIKPKTPFQIYLEFKSLDIESQSDKVERPNYFKEKWNNMSENEKLKWIALANEREQTCLNDLKQKNKDDPKFTMPGKRALTKGERIILDSQSGKPKKPPVNSYVLFSTEILQSDLLNGVPPKKKMSIIAQKWKSLSDEERKIYYDKLKVLTERYNTEFDTYLKTLPEDKKKLELSNIKPKKTKQKTEHKVVPKNSAGEECPEKPKKKAVSKYNSKTMTFENEPQSIPFKNAFELYKSKFKENPKFEQNKPVEEQALLEWNTLSDRKKFVFEDKLKTVNIEYMKNLKVFLNSLSEKDLHLYYLKLRKPELIAYYIENESDDSSAPGSNSSESSSSGSSSSRSSSSRSSSSRSSSSRSSSSRSSSSGSSSFSEESDEE